MSIVSIKKCGNFFNYLIIACDFGKMACYTGLHFFKINHKEQNATIWKLKTSKA